MKKAYSVVCNIYKKLKNPKISYILEKNISSLYYLLICSKCGSKYEKIFKEEESIKILKNLDLINNTEQYQKIWQRKIKAKNLDWKK